ncbi:ribonuclease P protein component [Prosthecomicrobium hirschii]|uniref:ribonuclease P protein component n=1 Tax=Prosthecodimorpha hirschii TaxID=665126 RepID=UPI0009FB5712|nr:ribonuclease P protein component [Prosthecomicrobium hirschii]
MDRLKKRAEFLAVAKGARSARRAFVLQALLPGLPDVGAVSGAGEAAPPADVPAPRIGYTVTKKVGNAVERNRIRRRLREAVRLEASAHARSGVDYVLVGRREALALPFDQLLSDLESAFRQVHRGPRPDRRPGPVPDAPGSAAAAPVTLPPAAPSPHSIAPGGTR